MNRFLKFAFAVCLAVAAGSASLKAQNTTVVLNGLGSSSLFFELGLGANSIVGTIHAPCVWSEDTSSVVAIDTSTGSTLLDKGNAWVAWTKGADGTCTTAGNIYAYLSTDSVVGNRCLYNSNLVAGRECSISYPTNTPFPSGMILSGGTANCGTTGECNLPVAVAVALNVSPQGVNFAGTDIRPEDAEFATRRALTNCGSVMETGTQYLGLGYFNGSTISSGIPGSDSSVNVINFTLPSAFFVTPVGAAPIIITVNDASGTGLRSFSNISSQTLSYFLDGTYSYTGQVAATPTATGAPTTVYIREPISGTYNTMEFNAPNRLGAGGSSFATSQDAGLNQPSIQRNCTIVSPWPVPSTSPSSVLSNHMNFVTMSGGARARAIGTLPEFGAVAENTSNSLGYGFWSAGNFLGFSVIPSASTAKYYDVDGVDPLGASGTIPITAAELANVTLSSTADGKYPLWGVLRLVNVGSTQNSAVAALATSAQEFSISANPDFVPLNDMAVVRSHFAPPGQTLTPTNGSGSTSLGINRAVACSTIEAGGDVGGVVVGLKVSMLSQSPLTINDQIFCATASTTGQTGHRR